MLLNMTNCRDWILVLLTGSVILGGILANPNKTELEKSVTKNNEWIYHPDEKEAVLGVVPLSNSESSKYEISNSTIGEDVSSNRSFIPLGENKKLFTTGKTKYVKDDITSPGLIEGESSIEAIPSTRTGKSSGDKHETTAPKSSVDTTSQMILENRTESLETGARSLHGNDLAVGIAGEKTDTKNSLHGNITDLSDVSMDYYYEDIEGEGSMVKGEDVSGRTVVTEKSTPPLPVKKTRCVYGNDTYAPGMTITRNCDDKCVCGDDGTLVNCQPLCVTPFVRAGREIRDPLCQEQLTPDKPCCAVLICAQDSEPEPDESCYLGNKTISRGDTVEDGCSKICVCEAQGKLKCRPRCSQSNSTSTNMATSSATQRDKCVPVPDPRDSCCTITLCDVTLGDLDQFKPDETMINLTKIVALNSTAIELRFSNNRTPEYATIEISMDHLLWMEQKVKSDGIIGSLEPSRTYYVRLIDEATHRPGPVFHVVLPLESSMVTTSSTTMIGNYDDNDTSLSKIDNKAGVCNHRGKSYKVGAEWYDECISFCTCSLIGNIPKSECATIQCPTDFGLEVLDPNCLDWEPVPADFVPIAPQCCSQEVRCRNNGSCLYEDKLYNNWSEIPSNVTGCEKRCYCELGNVSCHPACPPVTALPPANLQCPPSHASLMHLPEDECCLHWVCGESSTAGSLPTKFGRNVTTSSYTGPLATDSINQLKSIDYRKIIDSGNLQEGTVVVEESTDRYATLPRRKYHESLDLDSKNHPDLTDDHGQIHYPMDPGHPTITTITNTVVNPPPSPPPPYHGPYNPDFKPTQPSVEDVFRLTSRTQLKTNQLQAMKDRPKSKTESKKPIEPTKPIKDTYVDMGNANAFVTDKQINMSQTMQNDYRILPTESIPPHFPFHREFNAPDTVAALPGPVRYGGTSPGPVITGIEEPNTILPGDHQNNNLGMRDPGNNSFNRGNGPEFQRPLQPEQPGKIYHENSRPNFGIVHSQDPNEHELPEELYRLINLQHPGLIRLNEHPPDGHQGLYGGVSLHPDHGEDEHEGVGLGHQGSLQYFNPQIYSDTGEDYRGGIGGANGYQIHRGHPPLNGGGARQQIEELLLRVGEKDPNVGPFQRYPGSQKPNVNNKSPTIGPPRVIIPNLSQNSGLPTRLNHPFAGTTMIHDIHSLSGSDHNLPSGFPIHGIPAGVQSSSDQVTVQKLEAIAEDRVRLVFTVPHVLVGLHGRVEVRYTSDESNVDPARWKSQIFAPPDDLIATPQLEFELGDLTASTVYKVMVTVKLRDLSNSPTSNIYKVTTLEAQTDIVTLPPQIPTDAELTVAEVNSTWANIVWKKFTEYELQFIDGVQLRYKETEGKVYAATPLIHRAVTSYVIENLKPSVTYEVGIYFIPFPGQSTELVSERPLNLTTSAEQDPYSFEIKVDIKGIKSTEVEVAWKGVPYPEDKYVNIYRAIYQSDTGKEDTSTFKIAKRDSPARTVIGDLKPGTRYRLWIEVYLTNGRKKQSNVQDFVTKPGVPSSAGVLQQGKLASQVPLHEGDYYGPLVIVAIVAALAILSTLILLMMLMKRRSSSKADISPRKTTAAYDNPSYKVEIQQETMDL